MTKDKRLERMRLLRDHGVPDETIGQVFDISRQRVQQLIGRVPVDRRRTPPGPLGTLPGVGAPVSERKALADLPGFLRAWRADHGLTQRSAASVLGVPTATYIPWEQAKTGCSLPVLLVRFIAALEGTGAPKGAKESAGEAK